jgi:hypothetical protein
VPKTNVAKPRQMLDSATKFTNAGFGSLTSLMMKLSGDYSPTKGYAHIERAFLF